MPSYLFSLLLLTHHSVVITPIGYSQESVDQFRNFTELYWSLVISHWLFVISHKFFFLSPQSPLPLIARGGSTFPNTQFTAIFVKEDYNLRSFRNLLLQKYEIDSKYYTKNRV